MATATFTAYLDASTAQCGVQTDDSWDCDLCTVDGQYAYWDVNVYESTVTSIPSGSVVTAATVTTQAYTDCPELSPPGTYKIYLFGGSVEMTMPKSSSTSILPMSCNEQWIKGETGLDDIGTVRITNNESFYTSVHYPDRVFTVQITYTPPPLGGFFSLSPNS